MRLWLIALLLFMLAITPVSWSQQKPMHEIKPTMNAEERMAMMKKHHQMMLDQGRMMEQMGQMVQKQGEMMQRHAQMMQECPMMQQKP